MTKEKDYWTSFEDDLLLREVQKYVNRECSTERLVENVYVKTWFFLESTEQTNRVKSF